MTQNEELKKLIDQYLPKIKGVAYKLDYNNVDSLVEAGIVALVDSYLTFDKCRNASFNTYSYKKIRGAMVNEHKTKNWAPKGLRDTGFEMLYLEDLKNDIYLESPLSVEDEIIKRDEADRIGKAIDKLPTKYAVILKLIYWYSYTTREIASIFKCSRTWVCTTHNQAKQLLKEELKDE
jgi:RNA polymerase sigma factor (sigma-70 family)